MRIEVEWIDDADSGLTELEAYLRHDPRMDHTPITRGRPIVPPTSLGAAEVLELIGSNLALGVIANALYDFLRHRVRAGGAEKDARLRLTRTDLPDGVRQVEIEYSGSAATVERIVRDALSNE